MKIRLAFAGTYALAFGPLLAAAWFLLHAV